MKAEELMVGNWVRIVDDDTDQSFETRVTGVSGLGNIYASLPDGEHAYPFSVDCVEPIPLTPEILEKNGFERDFEDGSLIWVDERDVTEVVWGGTILTIHGENGHLELDTCMYIHELQHALRICGIEKEIQP